MLVSYGGWTKAKIILKQCICMFSMELYSFFNFRVKSPLCSRIMFCLTNPFYDGRERHENKPASYETVSNKWIMDER